MCYNVILLVLLIGLLSPILRDPILDTPYRPGGMNELSGWSVGFTWMGDPEQFRDDIKSGGFDVKTNGIGGFSFVLPLDEYALNLLGDTEVRIYYDGVPQFWGYIKNIDIDEASEVVNVAGGDMMEKLGLREVDYQSTTAGGADPPRGDQGSKAVFENLIHWYTGETASDSMFAKEFVEWSETEYIYTYDGNTLLDALIDVSKSSGVTIGTKKQIGYAAWIDGKGYIYSQPYGWRSYDKTIPGFWKLGLDYGPIRNRVHIRGGKPEAWENVEDKQENWSHDSMEDPVAGGALTAWDVPAASACAEAGSNPTADEAIKKMGVYSASLTTVNFAVETDDVVVKRDMSGEDITWYYTDEGGNVQPTLDSIRLWYRWDKTGGTAVIFGVQVNIWDLDADKQWSTVTGVDPQTTDWTKVLASEENMLEAGSMDWTRVDYVDILIATLGDTTWTGTMWFDGYALFFKKIDLWRRDEVSIGIHGLKEAKFQDGRLTDWRTAETIADDILEILKYPAVNASTSVPYYDPSLELNMLVRPVVEGVEWPLYVNGLSVKWAGDHASTDITAGRPIPDEDDILMSMHILRDERDEEDGYNFRVANTYEDSSCLKDKERFCRNDCQVSNCQNAAQLMACFTFQERNPCLTTCQRYKERSGWLNRVLDQA